LTLPLYVCSVPLPPGLVALGHFLEEIVMAAAVSASSSMSITSRCVCVCMCVCVGKWVCVCVCVGVSECVRLFVQYDSGQRK